MRLPSSLNTFIDNGLCICVRLYYQRCTIKLLWFVQGFPAGNKKSEVSVTILTDTENEFRISVRLRITNDFVIELLSRSTSLTVIKPASLRRRVAEIYEKALHRNMDK